MSTTPAERLRTLRIEQGFDIDDTARCLGVQVNKIGRIELGAQEPTLTDICALLATYRTSFDALFDSEIEQAKAEVYARIADYVPRPISTTGHDKRAESYLRLRQSLNQLHGSDC